MATLASVATKPMAAPAGTFTPNFGGLGVQDWLNIGNAGPNVMAARSAAMQKSGLDSTGLDNFINYGALHGYANQAPTAQPGQTQYGGTGIQTKGPLMGGTPTAAAGGTAPVTTYQSAVPAVPDTTDWSKLDINSFLNPNANFLINQGLTAMQNSAAANGNLRSGSTLKALSDYAQGQAQAMSYLPALQTAQQQQGFNRGVFTNNRDYATGLGQWNQNFGQNQSEFNTGVDQADRNFFYNAALNDRNFNYQVPLTLAELGLNASGQDANVLSRLASLLSANTIAGGTAAAQGTMGGSNVLANIISQLLGQYSNNQILNLLPGQ